MVAPSATCELYIDGVRVPDTADQYEAGLVTAMDGLSLRWGRDGQNEQPGPASLTVEFLDPAGNNDILDVLHVGSQVEVWAEGHYDSAGSDEETFDDPAMTSWPLGDAYASRYASGSSYTAATVVDVVGNRVLSLRSTSSNDAYANFVTVKIPPRRYSPAGDLPDAWDDIPRWRSTDAPWQASIRVKAPAGARVSMQIPFYDDPYPAASTITGGGPTIASAPGGWITLATPVGQFTADGLWLGLGVTVSKLATRWKDQPADDTWAGQDPNLTWAEFAQVLIDDTSARRPSGMVTRRVLVFSGETSDVLLTPAGDGITTAIVSTAMDMGAELGNTVIGDTPWPVQTAQTRANRITQLAGITSVPRIRIDDSIETLQLSARDVDAQPAFGLLQDLAQSIGGILWCATHQVTGAFLWIEDPATRAAVQQLVETGGMITIEGATRDVSIISACDLLEDPVSWRQDTADVITVVAVTWLEQGVDDDGQPTTTERTVTVTDTAAVATYGTRRLSVSTELIAEADATALANRVLAQARAVAWRLDGLTMDTGLLADADAQADDDEDPLSVPDADREIALLDLLDGTTRMGAAVTLVDMPPYAPRGAVSSVYVEGGTYTFTDGYWVLELTTTPSAGQGDSVTWGELAATHPTWTWQQFDPDIAWVDLYGVTV